MADVAALMAPEIERIKAIGFPALVECSTVGVGRRAHIDRAVSERARPRPFEADLSRFPAPSTER